MDRQLNPKNTKAVKREFALKGITGVLDGVDLATPYGRELFCAVKRIEQEQMHRPVGGRKRRLTREKVIARDIGCALADTLQDVLKAERLAAGQVIGKNDGTLGKAYRKVGEVFWLENDVEESRRKLREHSSNRIVAIANGDYERAIEYDRVKAGGRPHPDMPDYDCTNKTEILRAAKRYSLRYKPKD